MVSFIEQEKEEKSLVKKKHIPHSACLSAAKIVFFPSLLFLMEQKKKTF